jgi:hypothetical protein
MSNKHQETIRPEKLECAIRYFLYRRLLTKKDIEKIEKELETIKTRESNEQYNSITI